MSQNGKHPPDAPSEEVPAGIEQVGAFLHRWHDPAPDPAAKAALIALLEAELDAQRPEPAHLQGRSVLRPCPTILDRGV